VGSKTRSNDQQTKKTSSFSGMFLSLLVSQLLDKICNANKWQTCTHLWFFPRVEQWVMPEVPDEDIEKKRRDLIKLYAFSCECSRSFTKVTGAWVLTTWTFQPPEILIRKLYTPTFLKGKY